MPLPTEELKRRIDAARTLRGLKQRELADLLQEDGLGKHDVGRLERGELILRRVHLDALMRHLRVPEWWFTANEIELPPQADATITDRLASIEGTLGQLAEQAGLAGPPQPPGELGRRLQDDAPTVAHPQPQTNPAEAAQQRSND